MNIRKIILEELIRERLGIAEPSTAYTDIISNRVWGEFNKFYNGDINKVGDKIEMDNFNTLEGDKKFPVEKIELILNLERISHESYEEKYKHLLQRRREKGSTPTDFMITGGAYPFGHKNWSEYSRLVNPKTSEESIIIKLEVGISIDKDEFNNFDQLKDDIHSTVQHELNHLYETYNRYKSMKGRASDKSLRMAATQASGLNKYKIPNKIFKSWDFDFTYYIYTSEPHELNAQIQEFGYTIKKYGFDYFLNSSHWRGIDDMVKFNPDEFISKITNIIIEMYDEESVDYVMDRLKNSWVDSYEEYLIEWGEKDYFDVPKLRKMGYTDFIKFFGGVINKSGIYMRNKVYKMKGNI